MLKSFRLIATVLVVIASVYGAVAQTNTYKEVLLDGKPAKLNLVTGEITFNNGEIAKSRTAKKIKDSLLDIRTEIKTNLITDIAVASKVSQNVVITDSINTVVVDKAEDSTIMAERNDYKATNALLTNKASASDQSAEKALEITEINTSDFHIVKKGESLYVLSKRYNTSLGQLKSANNLETTLIKSGQSLRVRNFDSLEKTGETLWVVSKGDTLYNIAKRNNTTVDELKTLNELSSNLIKIGQKLQLNQNSALSKK